MTTRTIVSLSVPADSEQLEMILHAKKQGKNVSKFILGCMVSTSIGKERHIDALRKKVIRLEVELNNAIRGYNWYRNRYHGNEKPDLQTQLLD